MKKFHALDTSRLTITNLAGLVSETVLAGKAAGEALNPLESSALEALIDANNKFRVKLIMARSSQFTALIRKFDRQRGTDLKEIRRTAKTASKSSIAASAAAGKALVTFLQPYHDTVTEPLLSETASLNYLQTRFNADPALQNAAAVLQLDGVFASLYSANEQVSLLWNERAMEDAGKAGPSPTSLRGNLEKYYSNFCDITVRSLNLQPSEALENLFQVMNEIRIKYVKSLPVRLTGGNTSVDAIPAQPYTGKPVTPVPRVCIRTKDGTFCELRFTVDFFTTYRNNMDAGEAKIIIHGKGKYSGSHISSFHIVRS
jgi:uncharacterized membrane protein